MFLVRINEYKELLTASDQIVIRYILNNLEQAKESNIEQLATQSKVSTASILRLSKKLGYKGFPELRIAINGIIKEQIPNGEKMISKNELNDTASVDALIDQLFNYYQNTLTTNRHLLSASNLKKIIDLIEHSDKIFVVGVGNSGFVAKDFTTKLLKIGKLAFCESDSDLQFSILSNFTTTDLLIAISNSGETREVLRCAEFASDHHIPTVSITRLQTNPLQTMCDYHIVMTDMSSEENLSSLTSKIMQLITIDSIFINLLKSNWDKYEHIFHKINKN